MHRSITILFSDRPQVIDGISGTLTHGLDFVKRESDIKRLIEARMRADSEPLQCRLRWVGPLERLVCLSTIVFLGMKKLEKSVATSSENQTLRKNFPFSTRYCSADEEAVVQLSERMANRCAFQGCGSFASLRSRISSFTPRRRCQRKLSRYPRSRRPLSLRSCELPRADPLLHCGSHSLDFQNPFWNSCAGNLRAKHSRHPISSSTLRLSDYRIDLFVETLPGNCGGFSCSMLIAISRGGLSVALLS